MDEYEICKKSKDGKHVADWDNVKAEHDGNTVYIDVNCKLCGTSGCVGSQQTLEADINWG